MVDDETTQTGASWREIVSGSAGRLLGATVATAILALVVKLVATARELVTAYELGAGDAVDAYLLAFLIPSYVVNVVGSSFLSSLVPAFSAARARGGEEPQRLFSSALALAITINLAVGALLAWSAPFFYPYLAKGFPPEKIDLTLDLFYVLLPIALFSSVAFVISSVLNALERFAVVALAPIVTPIAMLCGLLAAGDGSEVQGLTWGTLAGPILELAVLAFVARRAGYRIVPRWHSSEETGSFAREYSFVVCGGLFMCAAVVVDQAFAASLESGSVAVMSYASKIVALVMTLFSLSAGTTIFPIFSRLAARGDLRKLKRAVEGTSLAAFLLAWPVAIGMIVLSEPLVRFLYERGSFTSSDTIEVAKVQAVYALRIPFYAAGLVLARLFSSLNLNRVLMHMGAFLLLLNALLDYLLVDLLGVVGIAWATLAVSVVVPLILSAILKWWIWPERLRGASS